MAYFDVAADAYVQFMGRFSAPLAEQLADVGLAGTARDARVLDVGCGPGMLTAVLARRCGEGNLSAVDPMPAFVAATAATHPEVDVREAEAESLPYADDSFNATLAQLVVHFMRDPVQGIGEMRRVTVPGGRITACVWDHDNNRGALSPFWDVVQRLDADAPGEGRLPGSWEGDLARMFTEAGVREVEESLLTVTLTFPTFEEWWQPFTLGVGPAGAYYRDLNEIERAGLVDALRQEHGAGPMTVQASAWTATGLA